MTPLYLASVSPRRREILRDLGLRFRLLRHNWHEPPARPGVSAPAYAKTNARSKALSALSRVKAGVVVGVDTVVIVKDMILGKPQTMAEAHAMLRLLSGRTHAVVSAIAVAVKPGIRVLTGSETSLVTFRPLKNEEIQRYVASSEPFDKAGAYAIQGQAGSFVARVSGCYLNVVGLPGLLLLRLLARAGYADA